VIDDATGVTDASGVTKASGLRKAGMSSPSCKHPYNWALSCDDYFSMN
jgi:hypothetical protein